MKTAKRAYGVGWKGVRMGKKIIHIILLLILCFTIFASCNHPNKENGDKEEYDITRYNAKRIIHMYREQVSERTGTSGLKPSFMESNSTKKLLLKDAKQMIDFDKFSPETRCYIVKETDQMEEIFETLPEIDLETQMIAIAFFQTTSKRNDRFEGFEQDGDVLKMRIKKEFKNKSVTAPRYAQNVWGFILDKLDVTTLEVVFIN